MEHLICHGCTGTGNVEVCQAIGVRRRLRDAVWRLAWGLIEVVVVALVLKVGGCQTTSIVNFSKEAEMRSWPIALSQHHLGVWVHPLLVGHLSCLGGHLLQG